MSSRAKDSPVPVNSAHPSVESGTDSTLGVPPTAPAVADSQAFAPPTVPGDLGRLAKYRILKELGRGGMGAVFLAFDERLERNVALKVMLPHAAANSTAKDRFLREARAAARVSSDYVVAIHEADEIDGVPFIALQHLQGYPLDEYLKKKGSPSLPQVIRIARETALGLTAAHKLGLVHRDIKPGNIWLEAPGGRVKILDFGLAKPVAGNAAAEHTASGVILGTPAYMAPEQGLGRPLDGRADLFSLGCMMYRLVTGKLPFERPTLMAILTAIATEEPPPVRELNPAVPTALAELIHQLLAKTPDDRPPSADAVAARLRAMSDGFQGSAATPRPSETAPLPLPAADPPVEPPRRRPVTTRRPAGRPWLWVAVASAAVVVVGGGVFFLTQKRDGSPATGTGGVTAPGQDGPPTTRVAESPTGDPDRTTAVWVLSLGGAVKVNGVDDHINDAADLPTDRFTLHAVSVAKTAVTDADMARFKACRGLTYLHMEDTTVADDGMAAVAALPALQELHMARTGVTDTGLAHFAGNTRLTALDLSGTKVTNAGLAPFADCRPLAYLYLRGTVVSDAGLKHLGGCLGLVHLDLSDTGVTDDGLAHLKGCDRVRYANLSGTGVTDAALDQLQQSRDLTGLSVPRTKVTPQRVAKFHAAMPGCEIEYDGGTLKAKAAADPDRTAAGWVLGLGGMVQLTGRGADIKAVADLPKEPFTLKAVSLSKTAATDAGVARLKGCQHLTVLDLDGTAVTDDGLVHLKGLKTLTQLDLSRTAVTDAGVAHLTGLKGLTTLSLDGAAASDDALAHLKQLPGLVILYLDGPRITNAGVAHLTGLPGLKQLFLTHSAVTDDGLAHLKEIQGLGVLSLGVAKVTDVGLAHLKGLTGLTYLDLDRTRVTDDGLAHLKGMHGLDYLVLDGTGVTDAGLVHLKELTVLKQLIVSHTAVADNGLVHLKELRALVNLDLSNTRVSDAGLTHLQGLTGLKALDVSKSKVTAKGVDAFHAAVPGCRIEHDGGTTRPKK